MNVSQPLVSVIMPVHNGEKYIGEAIESVLNQTFGDWELIIVDDGSKDSSAAIAEKYQRQDKRVVLIRQGNRGVSAARNHGLCLVRGQWVCFIDCDDVYFPDYIKRMVEISRTTGADYVCCDFEMGYRANHGAYRHSQNEEAKVLDQSSIRAFDYLCSQGVGTSPCLKFMSDKSIKKYQIFFDTEMTYGEDLFFCWKACLASEKAAYLPEKLYFYRQTINSAISKTHPQLYERYDTAYGDMEDFAVKYGFMCEEFRKSLTVSFLQRLPALVRMTVREKRGIWGSYKHILEIIQSERMREALSSSAIEPERLLTGGAKKLYLQARKKKVFSMMAYAYYSNLRMQAARKIKGER